MKSRKSAFSETSNLYHSLGKFSRYFPLNIDYDKISCKLFPVFFFFFFFFFVLFFLWGGGGGDGGGGGGGGGGEKQNISKYRLPNFLPSMRSVKSLAEKSRNRCTPYLH